MKIPASYFGMKATSEAAALLCCCLFCMQGSVPELLFSICEALGDEVDRLVRLVLVRLHGRRVRVKLSHLGFIGERVLRSSERIGALAQRRYVQVNQM